MLQIDTEVSKGIMFLHLNGILSEDNFGLLGNTINHFLYSKGMHYFVIDFSDINFFEENIIMQIQNKIIEISLNHGHIVVCGIDENKKNKLGFMKENLYYVNEGREAYKYLWM